MRAIEDERVRDEQELQHKQEIAQAKLDVASGLSNLLNAIAGEDAAAQKAKLLFEKGIAAAQVIIQTQIANAKAVAAFPITAGMPWVGYNNVMMGISLGTIAAQTIQGFSKINEQSSGGGSQRRLARGGVLEGASHANGGIKTPYGELEGQEAVINKKSTAMYRPLLSAINEAGGGVKFAKGGMLGNAGVSKSMMNLIDYDVLAGKIAQANMSLPAPQVAVNEINDTQTRVQTIENRASF